MPFAVPFLQDALLIPSTKVSFSVSTSVSYVFPPLACYFILALSAVTSQKRIVQMALLPVFALLTFRAVVFVEMSCSNPEQKALGSELMRAMISFFLNSLCWISTKGPLIRNFRPANSTPSTIMDALDLTSNFRGLGWNWSHGSYVPRQTRPTNRTVFLVYAIFSTIAQLYLGAAIYQAINTFAVGSVSDPTVPTIYDESLPFFLRHLRASVVSILGALMTYSGLQAKYELCTVLGVLVFGQDPVQWPPVFDNPWFATSLADLWSRRWHQVYRQIFLTGSHPFSLVFGRVGQIIGAFLTSAFFHHLMLITFDIRSEIWGMFVGFGMMGLGVLVERVFYKSTGRKVQGVIGWVWTMTWLLLWGNVIVDGFMRAGMFSTGFDMPLAGYIEKVVLDFDAWLHAI